MKNPFLKFKQIFKENETGKPVIINAPEDSDLVLPDKGLHVFEETIKTVKIYNGSKYLGWLVSDGGDIKFIPTDVYNYSIYPSKVVLSSDKHIFVGEVLKRYKTKDNLSKV